MSNPLPPFLFTDEFAKCIRVKSVETVRRKIRTREIKASGRPARIPISELAKFGVSQEDAARILMEAKDKT